MIGKILLILLGLILLLVAVLLLIPVNLRVSYDAGALQVWLRYASKTIILYPSKDKKEETAEPEPPDKEKSQENKLKKEKTKPNWEQISYSLDVLPQVLLRALRRTGRRIVITPLKFHLLVAGTDPADTAVLYGKLQGGLAAVLPALHKTVRIKEQDIRLFLDFCEERMDCIADLGIRIRPWDMLIVTVSAVGGLIKWYFGFKKCASTSEASHKNKSSVTVSADPAV